MKKHTAVRCLKLLKEKHALINFKHKGRCCWVCGRSAAQGASFKTSRMSDGVRCRKCVLEGRFSVDVLAYEQLKARIARKGV